LKVDKMLINAYNKGKVLCGVSAGSICWFDYGISDSLHFYQDDTTKYIKVHGLGILGGGNCPHYGSNLWDKGFRTKGMKELMKNSNEKCLAIPDGSAVIFKDDEVISIGIDRGRECSWVNEQWNEEAI